MKRLLFIFLITSFTCQGNGVEYIKEQYPQLVEFLDSEQFTQALGNNGLYVKKMDPEYPMRAEVIIQLDGTIIKQLFFNAHFINPDILSASELQFIICHELGHLNDPHFMKTGLFPKLAWYAGVVASTAYCACYERDPQKIAGHLASWVMGSVIVAYLERKGEYFADRFALEMTGDLEGAIAALIKRREWAQSFEVSNLPESIKTLFADHPTEEQRITVLQAIADQALQK